jgi:UDP-N-acetyl-D-mannosaminuronic acid transferase (WecB/TagA/CpsF family)
MQATTGADPAGECAPDLFSGISVNLRSSREAIDAVLQRLRGGRGFRLFTLNLDHIAKLRRDAAFLDVYRRADLVSADGWPVVWRYRRSGVEIERTTGADLVEPLCESAAAEGFPVYFLGPMPQVQAKAIDVLREQSPRLRVAGAEAPMIAPAD